MIYDCIMFNDETDLLDLRIQHHSPFVDRFIVIESAYTYSGKAKRFNTLASIEFNAAVRAGIAYRIRLDFPPLDRATVCGWPELPGPPETDTPFHLAVAALLHSGHVRFMYMVWPHLLSA